MTLRRHILMSCMLLLPACGDVTSDKDIPDKISASTEMTGHLGPKFDLATLTQASGSHMTVNDLNNGQYKLRSKGAVWDFALPIDWAADPFDDLNWRYKLHSWAIIGPYLSAYEKNQDKAAFNRAVDIISDWQSFHQDAAQTTSVSWVDMVTGRRAARLAWAISEAEFNDDLITDKQLSDLIRLADFHVQRMLEPGYMADNNHGLYDALGLLALCEVLDELFSCEVATQKANQRLKQIFVHQFAEDGGHKEHSPAYHYLGIDLFNKGFETGLFHFGDAMQSRWDKAIALMPWFLDGTGGIPAIGDSDRRALHERKVLCSTDETGCVQAAFLPKSGYGIVHNLSPNGDSDGSLIMSCGFHSYIHKHLDELSFEWVEQGQHILVDSGKYSYDNDETRHFMLSRVAHNSVKVKNERFTMERETFPGPCMRDLETLNDTVKLTGSYDIPGTKTRHSREVIYTPGHNISIKDTLSENAKAPKQLWHFADGYEITIGKHLVARKNELSIDITPPPDCKISVVKGQTGKDIQGWVATGYRKRAAAPTLVFSCPNGTTQINTRFTISDSKSAPKPISITRF